MGTPLSTKLRLQPEQRIAIIGAPSGYLDQLGPLPEGVQLADENATELDFVQLFVRNVAELQALGPGAAQAVKYDGVLWACYPKRGSKVHTDITRDAGWDVLHRMGLRPVSQVSLDDTWSALRFRPTKAVGKEFPTRSP